MKIDVILTVIAVILIIISVGKIIIEKTDCEIKNYETKQLDMRVSCYHGCQVEPEKTYYQLANCYEYCQKKYADKITLILN
jgi:hypothetical protein